MTTYTEANVETAMCLWEAALELKAYPTTGIKPEDYTPQEAAAVALDAMFEEQGTVAVRHTIIGWVDHCEAAWEAARQLGTELVPYDWEHCPAFLIAKVNEVAA